MLTNLNRHLHIGDPIWHVTHGKGTVNGLSTATIRAVFPTERSSTEINFSAEGYELDVGGTPIKTNRVLYINPIKVQVADTRAKA